MGLHSTPFSVKGVQNGPQEKIKNNNVFKKKKKLCNPAVSPGSATC